MKRRWMRAIRRWVALALGAAMLVPCAAWADHEVVLPYPKELQISMRTEVRKDADGNDTEVDFPVTCRASVNQRLSGAIEAIWQDVLAHAQPGDRVDVEATYRVSGTSWAGFLIIGRVVRLGRSATNSYETEDTTFLRYDVQSYDMATGQSLTLADVFPQDSAAWASVSKSAEALLRAYYPDETRDEQALSALCTEEALRAMPFLPCAGRLLVTLPLFSLQPEHWQLAQVILPYPDYREQMTQAAFDQTDNSARPIIAITFDDGPVQKITRLALRNLARYGASATFFCVGQMMERWPDIVRRELDYGHTVGSHSSKHKYAWTINGDYMRQDRADCLALHTQLLGIAPELFRAPGGNYERYIRRHIGWPLIQWSSSAGDTGNNGVQSLAQHVANNARDGSIILMHDTYEKTAKGAALFLQELTERGFMFATVEELLYLHGITPQPDTAYLDASGPIPQEDEE